MDIYSNTPDLDKCTDDSCVPPGLRHPHSTFSTTSLILTTLSSVPFFLTFILVGLFAFLRVFPYLTNEQNSLTNGGRLLSPTKASPTFSLPPTLKPAPSTVSRRLSALVFAITLGATGVLSELILCEIMDWGDTNARWLWFRCTINVLLLLLIIVAPLLEIYAFITRRDESELIAISSPKPSAWKRRSRGLAMVVMFVGWLWLFYKLGDHLPLPPADEVLFPDGSMSFETTAKGISDECLSRLGVIGVSLMALLSGFGCISAPWYSFTRKSSPVTETDLRRAQGGLEATVQMLESKRLKLAQIERKLNSNSATDGGMISKMMSSLRGTDELREASTLQMEISGLVAMQTSLSTEVHDISTRLKEQERAHTALGRVYAIVQFGFSIYCLYRISSTVLLRFSTWTTSADTHTFSQKDPIGNILAVVIKHYDHDLNREAWSRNIGFAFSGVIIFGSLNSVAITFNMVTRAAPSVWGHAGLALAVSQITAIYVVSAAVLLRSSLPKDMGSVLESSLGVMLDVRWVDGWFDNLFLVGSVVTLICLVLARRFGEEERLAEEDLMERGSKMN
ncbi:hypothetical protein H072_1924 [Dactylellina haptotyla CBS 200.50]|uniref:Abscisic acid G-protein coupled receptor-like domain-containing protein n=1 Tax=Dactylellina haptotyla (strain CBS 200.50) TaxID=1284197 RepID=S8ASR2_DACHA|nr:hypothetical protein H072_1924 [Dactylellina haptotyla CBS 200.50]